MFIKTLLRWFGSVESSVLRFNLRSQAPVRFPQVQTIGISSSALGDPRIVCITHPSMDRSESDRWADRRKNFKRGLGDRKEAMRKSMDTIRKAKRYEVLQRRRQRNKIKLVEDGATAAPAGTDVDAATDDFEAIDHLNLRLANHPMINMDVFNMAVGRLITNPGDIDAIIHCLVRMSIPEHYYASELPATIPASQVNSLYLAHLQELSDKLTPVTLPILNNAIKIIVNSSSTKADFHCADSTIWLISNILSAESLDASLCGPELVSRLLFIVKYMIDRMETQKPYWRTTMLVAIWSLSNVFGDSNCVLQFQSFDSVAGTSMAIPNGFQLMLEVMKKFKPGMEDIADQVGYTITNIVHYGNLDQDQADSISDIIVALCTASLAANMTITVTNVIHSFYFLNITHKDHKALRNAILMLGKGTENPLANACWVRFLAQALVRHITSGFLIDSVATMAASIDWSKMFCIYMKAYTTLSNTTTDINASISSILELMSHLVRMDQIHHKLYTLELVGLIMPYLDSRGTSMQRIHAMGFYSSPGSMDLEMGSPSMDVLIKSKPVETVVNFMVNNKHSSHVWLFQCCGRILLDMTGVDGMEQSFMEHVDQFDEIEEVLGRMGETSLASELVEYVLNTEKETVDKTDVPTSFTFTEPGGNPFSGIAPVVVAAAPGSNPALAMTVPDDVDTDM